MLYQILIQGMNFKVLFVFVEIVFMFGIEKNKEIMLTQQSLGMD